MSKKPKEAKPEKPVGCQFELYPVGVCKKEPTTRVGVYRPLRADQIEANHANAGKPRKSYNLTPYELCAKHADPILSHGFGEVIEDSR